METGQAVTTGTDPDLEDHNTLSGLACLATGIGFVAILAAALFALYMLKG